MADVKTRNSQAQPTLSAGMRTDPRLAHALHSGMLSDKVSLTASVFERAVARGEPLRPGRNLSFHELAPAVIFYRLLVLGENTDEAFLTHLVDEVLMPVLTSPSACPLPTTGTPGKAST